MKILILTFMIICILMASGCMGHKSAEQWYKEGLSKAAYDKGFEEAIRCYDKALEIDPGFSKAWFAKGVSLQNLQRYTEAIECYDNAIETNPHYALAYFQKSKALRVLGMNEKAEESYDIAITLDPRLREV